MKNIHLLPTNQPSKYVTNYMEQTMQWQNIYITSDEEIKEGEEIKGKWLFDKDTNEVFKCLNIIAASNPDRHLFKIILTTDQDLISKTCVHNFVNIINDGFKCTKCKKQVLRSKITVSDTIDGVQAIDDEFLEWFVKNPNCEEVEIGEGVRYEDEWIDNEDGGEIYQHQYCCYKIIIPKEEPKCFDCYGTISKDGICFCNREEPKQETLEEITEQIQKDCHKIC